MRLLPSILASALATSSIAYQSRHQNETLQLVLSQGFFDNFTSDFLAPTLAELTKLNFGDIVNQ
jgi:hypothetical protein